ncbi:signal peptidase I [Desulfonatronovibrio hydrogenovorans]|uniref:signal peptidase I n=1 Tax=Desulfonatronovibrio hydrogenovorans TaxID=53245 RepID=UPI00048ACB76|nr:signal peptidase I [Desulfonatronovibrio hydrogenovorans]
MNPRWQTMLKEYAEALIIALVLALFIRTFVVQAFKIPSGSMLQTLQIGDHLLVNKFKYGIQMPFMDRYIFQFDGPELQDIIVFEFPEDPSKDFIKRVVGTPGDVIEVRDKVFYRNGEPVHEEYIQHTDERVADRRDNFGPYTVPENSYFVLGDNRDESYDSRFWGVVEREKILGKAWIIYWSWEGFSNVRWSRIGNRIN